MLWKNIRLSFNFIAYLSGNHEVVCIANCESLHASVGGCPLIRRQGHNPAARWNVWQKGCECRIGTNCRYEQSRLELRRGKGSTKYITKKQLTSLCRPSEPTFYLFPLYLVP
ncbi:uncharacterized protein LOC124365960 [Homalodisca vitripennis]|uniref:uncharacterized protein LOC124365960 n=1 Tax=Homalodisca vitripennis TaxID=197043 RepID=UPI001EEC87E8|nr:uncharacterized protein LOC124365960 [Homalodisca vitripennis]